MEQLVNYLKENQFRFDTNIFYMNQSAQRKNSNSE